MSAVVSAFDGLPQVVKIILAIPFLDILWVVYRICKSVAEKKVLFILLGIILLIVGIPFLWLIDIITLIVQNKVLWC